MQLLCILIFIGVAQCDQSITPADFEGLCAPNVIEYTSYFQLSVQTSYITSCECMLSSNNYIKSGFNEIDQVSNDIATNLNTQFKNGIGDLKNMMLGLQTDLDKDVEEKLNSVLYMTTKYYQKTKKTNKGIETTLGEMTDIKQAQTTLTARRCESDYINFMNDIATIKSKYNSEQSSSNNINQNQWASLVKQYYEARETIICNMSVYTSIREAFLLGSGINLCEGSLNFDQSKLEIYKTDDLGNYFGIKDNNSSTLMCQTATQLYDIYKFSLTAIYIKSVVHSKSDLSMRIMIWEQVNLIRANFEDMCKNIDMFIKITQTEAESTYGADSEDYKKIMIALYVCVNKMLLTVVKSTVISYQRALDFNIDGSMITCNYNQHKVDLINEYYKTILCGNTIAVRYDARLIDQKTCSLPSKDMCIPQNMYALISNKLIFQSFICQANYLTITIKTTEYDIKTVDYWMFEKITATQLKFSIVFSRSSAIANKMLIINTATYSYDLITIENNTPSTKVQQIIDQISYDVVGTLCVHSSEIIEMSDTIDVYIDTNSNNKNASAVMYKPGFQEYTGQNLKSSPSGSNGTPSPNGPGSYPSPNGPGSYPSPNSPGSYPSPNGPGSYPSPNGPGSYPSPNGPGSYPSSNDTGSYPSPNGSGSYPSSNDTGSYPSPNGPGSYPSPNGPGSYPSPNGPGSYPSPNGPGSYPSPNSPGSYPSPNGPGSYPSPNGPGSYPSSNDTGSYPSPNGPGSYPSSNGTGSYPSSNGPSSSETGQGSSGGSGKPTYPESNYNDIDYSYITSGLQVTQSIENLQNSVECKIEKIISYAEEKEQNEYTKVAIQSLKISQQIHQYNVEYLISIASDSIQFISEETTIDSSEYKLALIVLYRDIQEKLAIVSLTMEVPLKRIIYSLNTNNYNSLSQTVEFQDYMKSFYQYFEVNCEEIYNNQNDAELFLKNSMTQINVIYEKVVKAVQCVPDDSYKQFLLTYLQKTFTAYTKTSEYFEEQIVQTKDFITKSGENTKIAFNQEMKQRLETILVIYSAVFIKCYQYSMDSSSITIFNSEYDVATQTITFSSYSSTTTTTTVEIEFST